MEMLANKSSNEKMISDFSKSQLAAVPEEICKMTNLKMLFLEGNLISKLPNCFFPGLPNLMWLDLRNNILECLPKTIANHQFLENLLLTNNRLKELPNELGTVTNLKALQLQNNPLIYPVRKIVEEGTKAIKNFLKEQYNKQYQIIKQIEAISESGKNNKYSVSATEKKILEEEKLVKVLEEYEINLSKGSADIDKASSYWNKEHVADLRMSFNNSESKQSKFSKGLSSSSTGQWNNNQLVSVKKPPALCVKKIDFPVSKTKKTKGMESLEEPLKIIHTINKSDSRISLKSYFNKNHLKVALEQIPENSLKEGWLNKLKILLNDQERILQQERNLRALAEWRDQHPQNAPKTFYDDKYVAKKISGYPYDTDPAYAKIPSREELTKQINQFLTEADLIKTSSTVKINQKSNIDLDRMINDLMEQLKEIESVHGTNDRVNGSKMDVAEKQIQAILKIHQELLKLKEVNETY